MDKLRKALSGQEEEEEERGFVAQVENNEEFFIITHSYSYSGSGHLQFVLEHSDQGFLYMFWSRYPLLYPGLPRTNSQPSRWSESLCSSLHSWELHSSWQVRLNVPLSHRKSIII